MEISKGSVLGHYEILEELGKGGMAEVYLAKDSRLGREVALKVLPTTRDKDQKSLNRFKQEAKTVAALNHPNIVTLFSVEQFEDVHFFTMERIRGETLKDLLRKRALTLDEFFKFAIPITDALSAAHEKGIIHRDLKPANIMINDEGRVKILDFGIAKLWDTSILGHQPEVETVTQLGSVTGTLPYMSPEQLQGFTVDQRSDIFSLGTLFYEMTTGKRPFRARSEAALITTILRDEATPFSQYTTHLPRHLEEIIRTCLVKEPNRRRQSALDLHHELKALKKDIEYGELVTDSDAITTRYKAKELKRNSLLIGISAAVLSAAGLWAILWFLKPSLPSVFSVGRTKQITLATAVEEQPDLAPDGKMLAYVADGKLWIRQISGGRSLPLIPEFPEAIGGPRWSPDGNQLVFYTKGAIYTIPALGGTPKKILELEDQHAWRSSPAWSPDGRSLAYVQEESIMLRSLEDHTSRVLATPPLPKDLRWSPDGRFIAFVSIYSDTFSATPCSIQLLDVEKGVMTQLRDNTSINKSPVWTPDGKQLLFLSNEAGTMDLYQMNVSPPGLPTRLTTGLGAQAISLSADGSALVYAKEELIANIWSVTRSAEGPARISDATPVTSGKQKIEGYSLSSDGAALVFDSNREGGRHIYTMPVTGGDPQPLTQHAKDDFMPSWSPDGTRIAFHSLRTGNREIFVMGGDGRFLQQVTHNPNQEISPVWSPDGAQLIFLSWEGRGLQISVEGEGGWLPPSQFGFREGFALSGNWSPDRSKIAMRVAGDSYSLWISDPDGNQPQKLVSDGVSELDYGTAIWSPDGSMVYFFGEQNGQQGLWGVPINGGPATLEVVCDDPKRICMGDFETDGKKYYFVLGERESDLWSMELSLP